MRSYTSICVVMVFVLGLLGCRDGEENIYPEAGVQDTGTTTGDKGPTGDGVNPDSGPVTCKETTIDKITDGTLPEKACVILKSVVVTSVDGYGTYTGDVTVQETAGGKGKGIKIYRPTRTDGKKISELKIGDIVKVQGSIKYWYPSSGQFDDKTCTSKKHIKELQNAKMTYLSSGAAPTPATVTEKDLLNCTTADQWEHVLVTLKSVRVNTVDTTKTPTRVYLSGGAQIGNDLAPTSSLKEGGCYTFTGPVFYFYGYRVHPRSAADIVTATGCPVIKTYPISDLQNTAATNHPADGTTVKIAGVVSAVDGTADSSGNYEGFWLQDPKGGDYSGIYIYYKWTSSTAAAKIPKVNDSLELTGTYKLYSGLNEISYPTWTNKGTVAAITPTIVAAKDVATGGAEVKKKMGMLVQVTNVTVGATIKDSSKKNDIGFEGKTSKLQVINWLHDFMKTPPAASTLFKTITGPLHWKSSKSLILPRTAADLTK